MALLVTVIRGGSVAEILGNSSIVQDSIKKQVENIQLKESEKLDFNPLRVYFGDDYIVNDRIIIRQPSIQDFIDAEDELDIYSVIFPFTANTTAYRVQLWDKGIDWNKITNQELFSILIKTIDLKYSKLIFGDIDFSTFNLCEKTVGDNKTTVLYSPEMKLEIDEETRNKMCKYIQFVFGICPPQESFTSNKILKQDLIDKDRQEQASRLLDEQKSGGSQKLLSMITFYLNHPGCKYKKNDLKEMKYFEFICNIKRLQIYESTRALYSGMYSGMCDLSKINPDEFNFMRDITITT